MTYLDDFEKKIVKIDAVADGRSKRIYSAGGGQGPNASEAVRRIVSDGLGLYADLGDSALYIPPARLAEECEGHLADGSYLLSLMYWLDRAA